MTKISNKLNKDTKKFWSFKDTTRHSNIKSITSKNIVRIFTLKKSFLIKILHDDKDFKYIIPLTFTSSNWPNGSYCGLYENARIYFGESNIVEILNLK